MGEDSKLTIALEELAAGTYDFSKMSEDAWADVDWSVAYDNLAKALRSAFASHATADAACCRCIQRGAVSQAELVEAGDCELCQGDFAVKGEGVSEWKGIYRCEECGTVTDYTPHYQAWIGKQHLRCTGKLVPYERRAAPVQQENERIAKEHGIDLSTLQDPPERGELERKARALAKAYWRGRGEEITKEQEDEFWLSFAKDAALQRELLEKVSENIEEYWPQKFNAVVDAVNDLRRRMDEISPGNRP